MFRWSEPKKSDWSLIFAFHCHVLLCRYIWIHSVVFLLAYWFFWDLIYHAWKYIPMNVYELTLFSSLLPLRLRSWLELFPVWPHRQIEYTWNEVAKQSIYQKIHLVYYKLMYFQWLVSHGCPQVIQTAN